MNMDYLLNVKVAKKRLEELGFRLTYLSICFAKFTKVIDASRKQVIGVNENGNISAYEVVNDNVKAMELNSDVLQALIIANMEQLVNN